MRMPEKRCETCGKQCMTRADARKAARNLNSHQQNDQHPVHAYRCGTWWHVGHAPQAVLTHPKGTAKGKPKQGRRKPVGPRPLTPHDQLPPELQ